MIKKCKNCGTPKDHSHFGIKKSNPDELQNWCKQCMKEVAADPNRKFCNSCGVVKSIDCFNPAKYEPKGRYEFPAHKGRHSKCKECCSKSHKVYHQREDRIAKRNAIWERNRTFANNKKAGGCIRCSEADLSCLEFHHLDKDSKENDIGKMIYLMTPDIMERLEQEIAKCVVLCSNCHNKLHAGRFTLVQESTSGAWRPLVQC